jgi:hypothetical protein
MIRLRLTPNTNGAGGTRIFHVMGYVHRLAKSELEMQLRDGRLCLQVTGDWEIEARHALGLAHSCADAERIHDGHKLIMVN